MYWRWLARRTGAVPNAVRYAVLGEELEGREVGCEKEGGLPSTMHWTAAFQVSVNRIVLVDDVDRISLRRELDVYCATTVIRRKLWISCLPLHFSHVFDVLVLLGLFGVAQTVSILEAIGADVFEPGAVAAVLVIGLTFGILETVYFLDGLDERSVDC
jgi:hypothetical protein